jgi:hypothetical protein
VNKPEEMAMVFFIHEDITSPYREYFLFYWFYRRDLLLPLRDFISNLDTGLIQTAKNFTAPNPFQLISISISVMIWWNIQLDVLGNSIIRSKMETQYPLSRSSKWPIFDYHFR